MANKGQAYRDGFIARGFSPVQAAVLAGNIQQESGFNPDAYNPDEDAYGGLQWRLDRKSGLENYAKQTGRKVNDPETQMDWIVQEMTGNEAANAAAFLAAQDAATANRALKRYIRYGDNSEGNRLNYALGYMDAGNEAAAPAETRVADAGGMVNPAFGGAEMPGTPSWSPSAPNGQAPAVSDDDLLGQFTAQPAAPAQDTGPSDDDLLSQWVSGGTPAPDTTSSADDDLLKQWLAPEGESPAKPEFVANPNLQGMPIFGPMLGAMGYNGIPQAVQPGYEPSMVPALDPLNAALSKGVESIPVIGKPLYDFGNQANALIDRTLTGQPVTAEQRDAFEKANQAQNPQAAMAGDIVGSVAPYLALGATAPGARLLGISGTIPQQMLMGGASNALIQGADTLARGGSSEQAGQNFLAGGLIGGAAPAVLGGLGKVGNLLLGKTSPELAKLAETARNKYDIPLGPGQISDNPMVRFADDVVNKMPFSGGTASAGEQQAAINREVAKLFGETADKITPDVMARAKSRLGNQFESVAARTGAIPADATFDQSMLDIMSDAQGVLTADEVKPLMNQFDQIMGKFKQGGNAIDGEVYQSLTRKNAPLDVLSSKANTSIGFYARKMRDALDDALERAAPADVKADLLEARRQYKVMKTVEGLAEKGVVGDISPALLLGAVRSSYDNMAYGGGGDLAELARIGQAFMKKPPSSGTAERLAIMNALTKVGGVGGVAATAAMNPGSIPLMAAVGLPAGAAFLAASKGAGALMRSDALANKLIANSLGATANPSKIRAANLLLRTAVGEGTGPDKKLPIQLTVRGGNPLLAQ